MVIGLAGCGDRPSSSPPASLSSTSSKRFAKEIVEVAPPALIQSARQVLDSYQPQIKIVSPRPGQVLDDTQVSVTFQVNDFPLFKDEASGLGPHLHVVLDNEKYQPMYDASQPIVFADLTPGTHTIRAFASRPWHESFKNAGAYAQVSFEVFTNTANTAPEESQPILTYSRPAGAYGAEPIMLDFYLTNAPLHVLARESEEDEIEDWQIRGTVNGQTFTFDTWEPIYLTGFVPGLNWVKLELVDTKGKVLDGPFNSTARLIDYQPGGEDALSKLVRGELSMDAVMQLVDPDYEPAPEVIEPAISEDEDVDERDESEVSLPESSQSASEVSGSSEASESSGSTINPGVNEDEPERTSEPMIDESTLDELRRTTSESVPDDRAPAIAPILSPVDSSADESDPIDDSVRTEMPVQTETEINAPIESPIEKGVDVMPPEFDEPGSDEELAEVAS
ncbi:MAG: hypothetical protein VKL39_01775 [Leptolyngbyaceae bacterium]|nr:hypothetical protein [Leptolyngbyaceae bacterium]